MKDIILSEKKPEYKIQAQLHLKEKKTRRLKNIKYMNFGGEENCLTEMQFTYHKIHPLKCSV